MKFSTTTVTLFLTTLASLSILGGNAGLVNAVFLRGADDGVDGMENNNRFLSPKDSNISKQDVIKKIKKDQCYDTACSIPKQFTDDKPIN